MNIYINGKWTMPGFKTKIVADNPPEFMDQRTKISNKG